FEYHTISRLLSHPSFKNKIRSESSSLSRTRLTDSVTGEHRPTTGDERVRSTSKLTVAQPHVHSQTTVSAPACRRSGSKARVIDGEHEGKRRCFTVRNCPMDRPGFRLHAASITKRSISAPLSQYAPCRSGPQSTYRSGVTTKSSGSFTPVRW